MPCHPCLLWSSRYAGPLQRSQQRPGAGWESGLLGASQARTLSGPEIPACVSSGGPSVRGHSLAVERAAAYPVPSGVSVHAHRGHASMCQDTGGDSLNVQVSMHACGACCGTDWGHHRGDSPACCSSKVIVQGAESHWWWFAGPLDFWRLGKVFAVRPYTVKK